ncbi:MAG: hypothetical protein ACR2JX_04665 [Mycobacteriales bacterium]
MELTVVSWAHRLRRSLNQTRRITWRRPHPPGGEITEEKSNRKGIAHSEMGALSKERHTHPEISTILVTLLGLETDLHADLPAHAHTGLPARISLQTDLRTDLMALLGLEMGLDTGPVHTGLPARSTGLQTDLRTGLLLNPDLRPDLYKGLLADTRLQ